VQWKDLSKSSWIEREFFTGTKGASPDCLIEYWQRVGPTCKDGIPKEFRMYGKQVTDESIVRPGVPEKQFSSKGRKITPTKKYLEQ
jgi:hypothetical protein